MSHASSHADRPTVFRLASRQWRGGGGLEAIRSLLLSYQNHSPRVYEIFAHKDHHCCSLSLCK